MSLSDEKLASESTSTLLVLGHPSHELRVFQWLLETKPRVFVLTNGSANRGFPVSEHTKSYLSEEGIPLGSLLGAFPDRDFYQHMQNKDFPFFRSLAAQLAEEFSDEAVSRVAGDAIEGFNPSHDVCRLLIHAAVLVANSRRKTPLENFEFDLVGPIIRESDRERTDCIRLRLSSEQLAKKIAAAKAYPGVTADVNRQLEKFGEESLQEECLRPSDARDLSRNLFHEKPPYEKFGEERVQAGLYKEVLRYSQHIRPLQTDLAAWVILEGGKLPQ